MRAPVPDVETPVDSFTTIGHRIFADVLHDAKPAGDGVLRRLLQDYHRISEPVPHVVRLCAAERDHHLHTPSSRVAESRWLVLLSTQCKLALAVLLSSVEKLQNTIDADAEWVIIHCSCTCMEHAEPASCVLSPHCLHRIDLAFALHAPWQHAGHKEFVWV